MELQLDPIVPMLIRGKDGKPKFNRGHRCPYKGMTFDEYYGKERAGQIRRNMKANWHTPGRRHKGGNCNKPCIAIHDGRIVARFPNVRQASSLTGISYSHLCRAVNKNITSRNGWRWFSEAESWKWCDLLTNR